MNALKAIWTVRAGIILGEPMEEYDRSWNLMSDEWFGLSELDRVIAFHAKADAAAEYARTLNNPGLVNWVRSEFTWI